MVKATKKSVSKGQLQKIVALEEKKRGQPSLFPDNITEDITCHIHALRDAWGVVTLRLFQPLPLVYSRERIPHLWNIMEAQLYS